LASALSAVSAVFRLGQTTTAEDAKSAKTNRTQNRIVRLRSCAARGSHKTARAYACSSGACRGSASSGSRYPGAYSALAAAWSIGNNARIYTQKGAAGFGAQNVSIGNGKVVARNRNVEVVRQRNRDSVIQ